MTDNEQMFKLTEAVGTLNANVHALLIANADAAKRRETMAQDMYSLTEKVEDLGKRIIKAETAADEYQRIKTMGRGYLAGALVSGAIAGGSGMIWFYDHVKSFFGALKP